MKAIILAGGKGTRLGVQDIPKPMSIIGKAPLLEIQIGKLKDYGIIDITLIIGHKSDIIEEYFGDGSDFGVNIFYHIETKPLGTTGGIKAVENRFKEDFIVVYGDIMFDMDIDRLIQFHNDKRSECTLVVHPNDHPQDSDLVEINDNGRIVRFIAKSRKRKMYERNLVNAGIYVFSKSIFEHIEKDVTADLGRDVFPEIYSKIEMYGYNTAEYIKDIGTPSRLIKVTEDYISGRVSRHNFHNKRPAIFIDRDGVINIEKDILRTAEDFELILRSSKAIQRINKSDYLAIVVTNQPGVAKNFHSIETLNDIHKKMDMLLGLESAKIDGLFFCPHHPELGYVGENKKYKRSCNCRKPNPGMILQAVKQFNIDLETSYVIGDSYRDIECGKKLGITTIGVRTGYGCKDGMCKPDHMYDDLYDAIVNIIKHQ